MLRWLLLVLVFLAGCGGDGAFRVQEPRRFEIAASRLGDPVPSVRDEATAQLIAWGPAAFDAVWQGLESGDAEVQWRCGKILRRWGWPSMELLALVGTVGPRGATVLGDLLFASRPEVTEAVCKALTLLPPEEQWSLLMPLAQDPRDRSRYNLALACGLLRLRQAAPVLRKLWEDAHEDVKLSGAAALRRLGPSEEFDRTLARLGPAPTEPAGAAPGKFPVDAARIALCHYNAACLYSLAGQPEKALDRIQRAGEAGFDDWAWAAEDPDLYWARKDPAFRAWLTAQTKRQ